MMTLTQRLIVGAMLLAAMLISCNNKTESKVTMQGKASDKIVAGKDSEIKRTPEEAHLYEQKVLATNAHRTTYTGPSNPEILWRTDVWEKCEWEEIAKDDEKLAEIEMDEEKRKEFSDLFIRELGDKWDFISISAGFQNRVICPAHRDWEDYRVIVFSNDGKIVQDEMDAFNGLLSQPRLINDINPVYLCDDDSGMFQVDYQPLDGIQPDRDSLRDLILVDENFSGYWTISSVDDKDYTYGWCFDGTWVHTCDLLYIWADEGYSDEYENKGRYFKFKSDGKEYQECVIDSIPMRDEYPDYWALQCVSLEGSSILTTDKAVLNISEDCEIEWMIDPGHEVISFLPDASAVALNDGSVLIDAYSFKEDSEEQNSGDRALFKITADGKHVKRVTPKLGAINSVAVSESNTIVLIHTDSKTDEDLMYTFESFITAIDNKGTVLWEHKLGDDMAILEDLWLDNETNIYYTFDGSLYSLDIAGNERWRIDRDDIYVDEICFASNGNMYLACNGEVVCVGDM